MNFSGKWGAAKMSRLDYHIHLRRRRGAQRFIMHRIPVFFGREETSLDPVGAKRL
jgi:hypothetical protein